MIDIGANHGQFVKDAFRTFGDITAYSFEPIPECFEELVELAKEHRKLHPIRVALSDRKGQSEFFVSAFPDSSSLQPMLPAHQEAWPHTYTERKIMVDLERLDALAPELRLEKPIFAKLDVQGHELAVLRGGRETFSLCQRVMVECNFAPLYEGQPAFDEIHAEMRSLGFLFDGFLGLLRHPATLELLSADAVFFRSPG